MSDRIAPEEATQLQKSDLYLQVHRKRMPWFGIGLGALGLFFLISAAVTPLTGRWEVGVAFPEWGRKLEDLITVGGEQNAQPNAFVVGSSPVLHHVVPSVLDAGPSGGKLGLRWYNAGVQRTVPPEAFYLAHELLDALPAGACEVLVVDVLPAEPMALEEADAPRIVRTMGIEEAWRRLRLLPWEEPVLQDRCWEEAQRILAAVWNRAVGFLEPPPGRAAQAPVDTRANHGFVPLRVEDYAAGRLKESRAAYLLAPEEAMAHNLAIAQDFDFRRTLPDPTVNWDCTGRVRPLIDQMQALKTRCDKEGIHVVFLFQKLWDGNGCVYFEAHQRWGDAHVLETMGYQGQEGLFEPGDSYDDDHWMATGARKFSAVLSARLASTLQRTNRP